jgi:hypothetical protein
MNTIQNQDHMVEIETLITRRNELFNKALMPAANDPIFEGPIYTIEDKRNYLNLMKNEINDALNSFDYDENDFRKFHKLATKEEYNQARMDELNRLGGFLNSKKEAINEAIDLAKAIEQTIDEEVAKKKR